MIKIYPTLTIEGTELFQQWKTGAYHPLDTENAAQRIARLKETIPEWVRIQRIQRDVPAQHISAGVTKSNLRQLVEKELNLHGKTCTCIRCREIGHQMLKKPVNLDKDDIVFVRRQYEASGGSEVFLSLEDTKKRYLVGYLRLRDMGNPHRYELIREPGMIIRELKVLGRELAIGQKTKNGWQHKGYGQELLREAERICHEEFDRKRLFVLSGVGVKAYYRNLGFTDDGVYLKKSCN
jgi:elongator complex protein 3